MQVCNSIIYRHRYLLVGGPGFIAETLKGKLFLFYSPVTFTNQYSIVTGTEPGEVFWFPPGFS